MSSAAQPNKNPSIPAGNSSVTVTAKNTYTVTIDHPSGNKSAQSIPVNVTTLAGSGSTPFTPLHTYYVSPTGSDSNNGLTPATAWATANHSVVCGDVIIAAAGSYGARFGDETGNAFGTVSNCPSTTGGIDGTGGIYFAVLLCGGPDLMSCQANGGSGPAFEIDQSNWAVEGFWATMDPTGDRTCFGGLGTKTGVMWHHIAFINNIASTCNLAGFNTGNIGINNAGPDQTAMIGGIVYNGANSLGPYRVCGSGISVIPAKQNTDAGTHIIVEQNFVYKSTNSPGASQCTAGGGTYPHSDGQGIILDSWGFMNYPSQAVIRNNVMWQNGNQGFQVFPQGNGTTNDRAKIYVRNNTSCCNFNDNLIAGGGDLWLHGVYPSGGGFYKVQNNIFLADKHSPANNGNPVTIVTAAIVECPNSGNNCRGFDQTTILVDQNYIWNSYPPTTVGLGGYNTFWNSTWPWGKNTYDNPGLTSPYSLPTTAPDCTGYTNTVDCMLTKYNVYNNIKPTIAPLTMGYQPPSTCSPDPLFPTWLKGIVYLQASGSSIRQTYGMMTLPCGM